MSCYVQALMDLERSNMRHVLAWKNAEPRELRPQCGRCGSFPVADA